MGDILDAFSRLNLSPFNTVLLCGLAFFIRWAVKGIFNRLDAIDGSEGRLSKIDRRNQKQNLAIALIEQRLGMEPQPDDDEH